MPRHVRVLCVLCRDWRNGGEFAGSAGMLSSFCCLTEALDVVVGERGSARRPVGAHACSSACTLRAARRMGGVERLLPNGAAYGHALTMSETSER